MKEALGRFELYLHANDSGSPPLVRLALIHVQFEMIHPFLDGNGRVGRLLITLLLMHWKLLTLPLLYLSAFFERRRDEYYRRLAGVSQSGEWEEWIAYFLEGVRNESRDAADRAKRLHQTLLGGVTYPTAKKHVQKLLSLSSPFAESVLEDAVLEWFGALGYEVAHGPSIAPGEPAAERTDFRETILRGRLLTTLRRLNPDLDGSVLQEAERQVLTAASRALLSENRRLHRLLVDGVSVEVPHEAGGVRGVQVRLIDWDEPANDDWLVVNQLAVKGASVRRPDVVVFVNGLPLAVLELKDPADEGASVWDAYQQLQTYKQEIPDLFRTNAALVASDGVEARISSLTAPAEWFQPWRTVEGHAVAATSDQALAVLIAGVFDKARFLDLVRHFTVFTDEGSGLRKVLAGYHQFHATRQAVATTLEAAAPEGDRRAGVVWHTQGSGKSLTMAFYRSPPAAWCSPPSRSSTLMKAPGIPL